VIGQGAKTGSSTPSGAGFPANSSPKSFSIFNSMNTCRALARDILAQNGHRESCRYGSFCLARLISRALGRSHIEKSPIPLKVERISGARHDFYPPHVTVLKRSARRGWMLGGHVVERRPDHQQTIRKLTLVGITSLFSDSFFFPPFSVLFTRDPRNSGFPILPVAYLSYSHTSPRPISKSLAL